MSKKQPLHSEVIEEFIKLVILKKRPETIEELLDIVQKETKLSRDELITIIDSLREEKNIELREPIFPVSAKDYYFSRKSAWYWFVLLLSICSVISVLVISEESGVILYLRALMGLSFVLYLPGYVLIKALYPVSVPLKTSSNALDTIERITLSLGSSLAVSPLIGTLLYFSPISFSFISIVTSLFLFIVLLDSVAVWSEYRARKILFYHKVRKGIAYFKS